MSHSFSLKTVGFPGKDNWVLVAILDPPSAPKRYNAPASDLYRLTLSDLQEQISIQSMSMPRRVMPQRYRQVTIHYDFAQDSLWHRYTGIHAGITMLAEAPC